MKVVMESRVSDLSGLVTVSSLNCRRPPLRGAGACRDKHGVVTKDGQQDSHVYRFMNKNSENAHNTNKHATTQVFPQYSTMGVEAE